MRRMLLPFGAASSVSLCPNPRHRDQRYGSPGTDPQHAPIAARNPPMSADVGNRGSWCSLLAAVERNPGTCPRRTSRDGVK